MPIIIILNKPYKVLSQFSDMDGKNTLKNLLPEHQGFYPAGRLDYDSEGLLLLTDDGRLQDRISNPRHKQEKTYWVQVEGTPGKTALDALRAGVVLKDGPTLPAKARIIREPDHIWPRQPPIRTRQSVPTAWLEIRIHEGRNRQVRRMTAAVGHPTLRLIRAAIGDWSLAGLQPGEYRLEHVNMPTRTYSGNDRRPPASARARGRRNRS